MHGDAALVPNACLAVQQLHGHGVQHFVADDDALHLGRQRIGPLHQMRKARQPLLLALAQAGRNFDNGVLPQGWRGRCSGEYLQHLLGQCTAACTKFPHGIGAGVQQGILHLHRQCLAKQGAEFGRGHKIAAIARPVAQRIAVAGVVAQVGCVQRQMHEAVKRQPAAGIFCHGLANDGGQRMVCHVAVEMGFCHAHIVGQMPCILSI